jgi:hypothetical protein
MRTRWFGPPLALALLTGCGSGPVMTTPSGEAPSQAVPPSAAPSKRTVTIAQGTTLKIRTARAISTESAKAGERFSARLAEPLVVDGVTIAPPGARVAGVVASADRGGRIKGVASLGLRLESLRLQDHDVALETDIWIKQAPTTKKQDAMKVGIGAGLGAAVGAIAGGGKGAGIGAASGAGAGAAVVLATRGAPAVVAAESTLSFRLTAPLTVTLQP